MDKFAVIDFGGQYAHLIATRLRQMGVYSEIFLNDVSPSALEGFRGIILSGGPRSVTENGAPKLDEKIFSLNIPILGICYGHHYLGYSLGGKVQGGKIKEYGLAYLKLDINSAPFQGMKPENNNLFQMWMSHGDEVASLPKNFVKIGESSDCAYAAIADEKRKIYGVQFHPEVTHSIQGIQILKNFVFKICGAKKNWLLNQNFLKEKIKKIAESCHHKKVFFLVSGGVDSTVAFTLLSKAIPKNNLYGLFVDTGFMRKNEREEVTKALRKQGINLHVYSAKKEFFGKLKNVFSPEEKRQIIGDTFLEIKDKFAKKLGLLSGQWILGQGTIYPDTIESGGTKNSDKIKTHHNRVDKIQELIKKNELIEPLCDLYKDEVRKIGKLLKLPDKLIQRHPFPGPGLAVRCICSPPLSETKNFSSLEKEIFAFSAKDKLLSTLKILPIKSVGVQGDARTYRNAVVFAGTCPKEILFNDYLFRLGKIAAATINRFSSLNRALYLLSSSEIKKIDLLFPTDLSEKRISLLREADDIVDYYLKKSKFYDKVWQFPVILAPVQINGKKGECVILRPTHSKEAMTADFAFDLPWKTFFKPALTKLGKLKGISAVLLDITNKPPATIEWE